ncbi:MAG: YcxB family protein [Firmicutes bacterium]|nr:YcxB family protein [Bacillota bacterium]HOB34354.1 YcxB family protein [Bacillota bacterium]HPZ90823.1 YcxB family protein [Bacillota bacterium]HQE02530.1 YcxB family protein [Bacillota bacterium]
MEQPFVVVEFDMDYSLYRKFFKFHSNRGFLKYLSAFVYILLAVGIIGTGLLLLLCPGLRLQFYLILFLVVLGLKLLMDYGLPKLAYKNTLAAFKQTVRLFSDHFITEAHRENHSGQSTTQYTALHRAYENKEMFYLYIARGQAFLLPKAAMAEEAIEQLRNALRTHLGSRFKQVR